MRASAHCLLWAICWIVIACARCLLWLSASSNLLYHFQRASRSPHCVAPLTAVNENTCEETCEPQNIL